MTSVAKQDFLAAIPADIELNKALGHAETRAIALKIARAAGFDLEDNELRCGAISGDQGPSESASSQPSLIDFDGDGVPDAILERDRYSLISSDG